MPTTVCKTCGRMTNSVVSNYFNDGKAGEVTKCYAAFNSGLNEWVYGCYHSKLSESRKERVDNFIERMNEEDEDYVFGRKSE